MEERYRFLEKLSNTTTPTAKEAIVLIEIRECARRLWSMFQEGGCDVGRAIAALDKLTEAAMCCQQACRFPTIKEAR